MNRARRFLIDATMTRNGGGFTFVVGAIPHLARLAPEDQFRVLVESDSVADALPDLPNLQVDRLPATGLAGRFRFTYRDVPKIAKEWGADLFYSAGEYGPLRAPCPVITSCQNFNVFSIRRDWPAYQQFRLRLLRGLAQLSAMGSDRIHFVSETSAEWIGDQLRLPAYRRAMVPHGIDLAQWRKPAGPPPIDRPYILSVSSVYRYKNFVRLIEAYEELAFRRYEVPDLVIVGDDQDPDYQQKMEAAREATGPFASRIHLLGEVPYADVQRYYAGASLFVFPSYLETFGLPLLEAMASEVPLVASDMPVFREIAGDAAFYADPHGADSIADAMEEALFREGAAETLRKHARERVNDFTWEGSASRLLSVFREVVAERELPFEAPVRELEWETGTSALPVAGTAHRDAVPS